MTNAAIIDYVLVQLREKSTTSTEMYSRAIVLNNLIKAERDLCLLLDPSYVPEIIKTQTSCTLASGKYALTGISAGVLGGETGVLKVKLTGGRWLILVREPELLDNIYAAPTAYDPGYRVMDNSIVVYQGTGTNGYVNIEYREVPAVNTSTTVPTISAGYHEILARLTECYCRQTIDEKPELTQMAINDIYKEIAALNKKVGA